MTLVDWTEKNSMVYIRAIEARTIQAGGWTWPSGHLIEIAFSVVPTLLEARRE